MHKTAIYSLKIAYCPFSPIGGSVNGTTVERRLATALLLRS